VGTSCTLTDVVHSLLADLGETHQIFPLVSCLQYCKGNMPHPLHPDGLWKARLGFAFLSSTSIPCFLRCITVVPSSTMSSAQLMTWCYSKLFFVRLPPVLWSSMTDICSPSCLLLAWSRPRKSLSRSGSRHAYNKTSKQCMRVFCWREAVCWRSEGRVWPLIFVVIMYIFEIGVFVPKIQVQRSEYLLHVSVDAHKFSVLKLAALIITLLSPPRKIF
jgi:hypothetical protein